VSAIAEGAAKVGDVFEPVLGGSNADWDGVSMRPDVDGCWSAGGSAEDEEPADVGQGFVLDGYVADVTEPDWPGVGDAEEEGPGDRGGGAGAGDGEGLLGEVDCEE
jgi:hypothetical protein